MSLVPEVETPTSAVEEIETPPSGVLSIEFSGYSQEDISRLSRDEIINLLQNRMVLKDGLASVVKRSYEVDEPITEFTNFGLLPPEIHIKIWKLNLPGPRMIEVKPGSRSRYVGTIDPIINLAVCRDSRYEALREYKLVFPSKLAPAQVYVNFAIDTVFLNIQIQIDTSGRFVSLADSFSRIRFLALNKAGAERIVMNPLSLKCLPGLEELTLVEDGRQDKIFNDRKRICVMPLVETHNLMPRWWTALRKSVEDMARFHLRHRGRFPEVYPNHPVPHIPLTISCTRIELEHQTHFVKIKYPVLRYEF